MDSRNFLAKVLLLAQLALCGSFVAAVIGCGPGTASDHESDNLIGNPMQKISSLSSPDGTETQGLVLFDKMLRRIHQFDLGRMAFQRSFQVEHPELDHYVVYGKDGNYVIDLSLQNMTIFNKYNQSNHLPSPYQGKPRGTAYEPNSGIFLVYDDLMTVKLFHLDPNGEVLKSVPLGAGGLSASAQAAIAAGDLTSNGDLVVALTDGQIITINTMATIAAGDWVERSRFSSGLIGINWVAPIRLSSPTANQTVLVKTDGKLILFDLVTQTALSTFTIDGTVQKVSKYVDPHIVIRKNNDVTLAYASGGAVVSKSFVLVAMPYQINAMLSSNLNLAMDSWSFVDSTSQVRSIFNDLDETRKDRQFKRFKLSQKIATHNRAIDNDPQVELSETFIFALYPNELGRAVRTNIDTNEKVELKLFNLHYVPVK